MSIPDKSVGGQLDLLGYEINPKTSEKTLRLIDLKLKVIPVMDFINVKKKEEYG